VDSCVIIAAMLSPTGGSSLILTTFDQKQFLFETNEYAMTEMKNSFSKKFKDPQLVDQLHLLIGVSQISVIPNPDIAFIKRMERYVPKSDATIMASAIIHSDYLLTLDNGFFSDAAIALADRQKVRVLKPKDFIELFR